MTHFVIKVEQDDIDDNNDPRNWDNLGAMSCKHSRYNLGDKDVDLYDEITLTEAQQDWASEHYVDRDDYSKIVAIAIKQGFIVLPLFLYDHSGITMSTSSFSCQWDSGQVGFIYVSPERIREEYGCKRISKSIRNTADLVLKGEVKTYDQYLTGDIYYIQFEDEDGDSSVSDSCGGFFGYEYAQIEADRMLEHCIAEDKRIIAEEKATFLKWHCDKVKTLIKNHVPLQLRPQLLVY